MSVLKDFIKVRKYLELSPDLTLEVNFDTEEGFFSETKQTISVGVKNGYNRRLLVHECLHAAGMEHYAPPTYQPVMKWDEYSAGIEEKIFAVHQEGR